MAIDLFREYPCMLIIQFCFRCNAALLESMIDWRIGEDPAPHSLLFRHILYYLYLCIVVSSDRRWASCYMEWRIGVKPLTWKNHSASYAWKGLRAPVKRSKHFCLAKRILFDRFSIEYSILINMLFSTASPASSYPVNVQYPSSSRSMTRPVEYLTRRVSSSVRRARLPYAPTLESLVPLSL